MLRLITHHILRFLGDLVLRSRFISSIHLNKVELEDVLPEGLDEFVWQPPKNFRACASAEDYNHEVSSIFQSHSMTFFVDRTHSDGHFRV